MIIKENSDLHSVEDYVVISGISAAFPEAENIGEFSDKLLLGCNLLTDSLDGDGKLKFTNKFDAEFFNIKDGNSLDPGSRVVLEKVYEAIVDSGTNISTINGKSCGVYVTLNVHHSLNNDTILTSEIPLSSKICNWLGVHGPSVTIASCPSTLQLLEIAVDSILNGKCESAVVGACNFFQDEPSEIEKLKTNIMNPNKISNPFDDNACGMVKSEAVGALYLQRVNEAKRVYAKIVAVGSNHNGNEPEKAQMELLETIYKRAAVNINDIHWIEAYGSAIKAYDEREINVLAEVFKNKQSPLLISSVKSNVGNSESAADIASIVKVVAAMERNVIPATINITTNRNDIEVVKNERVKVITENLPWNSGLVGINSFNLAGNNYHCLLESVSKSQPRDVDNSSELPRVVSVSGRTKEAVDILLSNLENKPLDFDYMYLLYEVYKQKIEKHPYRGFLLIPPYTGSTVKYVEKNSVDNKPVWYMFPDCDLLEKELSSEIFRLDRVKDTIYKCHEALKYKGLDLVKTLKSGSITDPVLRYISNAVYQFVLVEFLSSLNIKPDGYVGYSMGEIACAYMDGHITVEEAVLIAYYFAYFIFETGKVEKERIGTAVVGGQYGAVKSKIPVLLQCRPHQNIYFTVIWGPLETLEKFITRYNYKCVTKIYKDRYEPINNHVIFEFTEILNQVIGFKTPRSARWISASASQEQESCCAEYFVNALLKTSSQWQPFSFVPQNAVVLVIGSDDITETFQIPDAVEVYPLLRKNESIDFEPLLTNIGRAYVNGVDIDFGVLYAAVETPVRKGTRMISPLIRWDHTVDYNVPFALVKGQRNERLVSVSLNDEKMRFIAGHGIDVVVLYPGMGYLVLVWETLALIHSKAYTEFPVVFENVRFSRATVIPRNGSQVVFHIAIQKISGYFELTENDQLVAAGYVSSPKNIESVKYKSIADSVSSTDEDRIMLKTDDLYQEFYLRGYNYKGVFQSLIDADMTGQTGRVRWPDNWVPFLDCMLQTQLLQVTSGALIVPTSFDKIIIDVNKQKSIIEEKNAEIPVYSDNNLCLTEAGGVQMKDVRYKPIPRKPSSKQPVLLKYQFVPFISQDNIPQKLVATIFGEILMEHMQTKPINVAEIFQQSEQSSAFLPYLLDAIKNLPIFSTDYTVQIDESEFISTVNYNDSIPAVKPYYQKRFQFIILTDTEYKTEVIETAVKYLTPNGFLALKEKQDRPIVIPDGFKIYCDYISDGYRILLTHKEDGQYPSLSAIIKISSENYSWISALQNVLKLPEKTKIYLLSEKEPSCGILGFYNCLRMERGTECVRCISVVDATAPAFSLENNFYKSQLTKNLSINIYKDGKWGRYIRLHLDPLSKVKVPRAFVGVRKVDQKYRLDWLEGPNEMSDEKLIYPYYSSVNTTDVLLITGRIAIESIVNSPLDKDYVLGREFVGYGKDGKRYMGICNNGALSTMIKCTDELLLEVPNNWNLEDAATVPFAYFIALYALTILAEIKEGDSILIHAGATILGQAAIYIASFYKCDIFVTVANAAEKTVITDNFPNISESRIESSNSDTFEQHILTQTNGKGVNLVLSSLNEDKILPSINCLCSNGHFIQTKKIDFNKGHAISSTILPKNITFHSAVFEDIIELPAEKKLQLKKSFEKHLSIAAVKPLTRITFNANDLDSALKNATLTKNTKKILIKIHSFELFDNELVSDAVPRFLCSSSKSYVVCGGLGGIGLQLINWLIIRGARKLVVTSRSGVTNGYQNMQIAKWKSYGVQIVTSKANVSNPEETRSLLEEANSLGPVAAIFNLAAVLRDKVFKNQSEEFFKVSADGKATGTRNLDKWSRVLCPHLEHFVVFSSISCGYGNIGQTNYGMSNSTAERICEQRRSDNLPALAVQWGGVGDVGMAVALLGDKTDINIGGTLLQPIASCLESLEQFLLRKDTIVTSFVMANKK